MPIHNATPEAYQLYLEGQSLFSVIERAHLQAAIEKFEAAIGKSEFFARAWGYRSYCTAQIVVAGHAEPFEVETLKEDAENYAKKAVDYGGDDYANHWDLAFAKLHRGKYQEAKDVYDHALALFDHETDKLDRRNDLLVDMAEACIFTGDIGRAMQLLDRAVRIPDWYRWIRAWAEFNAENYPEAITQINAMRKKPGEPGYVPDIQLLLAVAYACNNQDQDAGEALARLKTLRPAWTLAKELERNPFVKTEDRQRWEDGMKRAKFS